MSMVSALPKYKVVFLGDESVGKTSIIIRFMYYKFHTTYQATIGIDILSTNIYLEDRTVRLQLWDTAGQERFRSLILSYIRDSVVAVIVYDVSNRQSFLNIVKWLEEVRNERGTDVIIVLVGNKTDLVGNKTDLFDKRQVSNEEGDGKARELGLMLIETNAKVGFNIKPLFRKIARICNLRDMTLDFITQKFEEVDLDEKPVNKALISSTSSPQNFASQTNFGFYEESSSGSPPSPNNIPLLQAAKTTPVTMTSPDQKTVNIPEQHFALFSAFMASYEDLVKGDITPVSFMSEDLEQVNPDDLELLDIRWNMAFLTLRAKKFLDRTGKKKIETDLKVGFDKKKV